MNSGTYLLSPLDGKPQLSRKSNCGVRRRPHGAEGRRGKEEVELSMICQNPAFASLCGECAKRSCCGGATQWVDVLGKERGGNPALAFKDLYKWCTCYKTESFLLLIHSEDFQSRNGSIESGRKLMIYFVEPQRPKRDDP